MIHQLKRSDSLKEVGLAGINVTVQAQFGGSCTVYLATDVAAAKLAGGLILTLSEYESFTINTGDKMFISTNAEGTVQVFVGVN